MTCELCREALSARLDGEAEPSGDVDHHLAGCAACSEWHARVQRLHRSMLLRAAPPVPDLTELILERTPAPTSEHWPARIALGVVAVAQLTLALAQLLGVDGLHGGHSEHLAHESSAWNLAIGVGLLWAVVRTKTAAGQLPMLTGFVLVLAILSAGDVVNQAVTAGRLLSHGLIVLGLILLYVVHRQHRTHGPNPAATEDADYDEDISTGTETELAEHEQQRSRFKRPASRTA